MDRLPDYVETKLHTINAFSFLLPVSAFGYQDTMMMEITVEYHSSDIDAQYVGEVWARQDCAPIKHFIMWTEIELKGKNIPEAFFDALNRDACFHENMHDFIYEAAKHRYDI